MNVNVEELRRALDYIADINNTPLEDIWWEINGEVMRVEKEKIEEWKFIGLSNVFYAEDNLL